MVPYVLVLLRATAALVKQSRVLRMTNEDDDPGNFFQRIKSKMIVLGELNINPDAGHDECSRGDSLAVECRKHNVPIVVREFGT